MSKKDMANNKLFFQFKSGKVNAEAGIIPEVSVCTVGEAKGHGVFCDMTMLEQVKGEMERKKSGTKVQLDHTNSAREVIGKLVNPRIQGDQLFADFHLFNTSPHRSYILEVANEIPEEVGMSISFSGKDVQIGDKYFARCEKLHSCDLVSRPAANPGGLFESKEGERFAEVIAVPVSASTPQPQTPVDNNKELSIATQPKPFMDEKTFSDFKATVENSNKTFADTLSGIQAQLKALSEKETVTKLDVATLVCEQFAKLGQTTVKTSTPPPPPAPKKDFDALVKEQVASGKKLTEAIVAISASNPAEYQEYRNKLGVRML